MTLETMQILTFYNKDLYTTPPPPHPHPHPKKNKKQKQKTTQQQQQLNKQPTTPVWSTIIYIKHV